MQQRAAYQPRRRGAAPRPPSRCTGLQLALARSGGSTRALGTTLNTSSGNSDGDLPRDCASSAGPRALGWPRAGSGLGLGWLSLRLGLWGGGGGGVCFSGGLAWGELDSSSSTHPTTTTNPMPAAAVSAARAPVLTLSLPPKATPWRRSSFKGVFDSGPGAAVPPVIGEQAWTGGRAGLRREPRIPRHADRRPGLDAPQKTKEAASCQNPGARARSRCWHLRHRVVAPRGPAALVCAWVRGWDGHGDGDGMGHGDRDAGTNEGPPAAPPRWTHATRQ